MKVPLAVIFKRVTAADDVASQHGVGGDALADAKERGAYAVFLKHVEEVRRDLWVRAVVDGERNLPLRRGARRQPHPVGPEQPAAGPESARRQNRVIRHEPSDRPRPQ